MNKREAVLAVLRAASADLPAHRIAALAELQVREATRVLAHLHRQGRVKRAKTMGRAGFHYEPIRTPAPEIQVRIAERLIDAANDLVLAYRALYGGEGRLAKQVQRIELVLRAAP